LYVLLFIVFVVLPGSSKKPERISLSPKKEALPRGKRATGRIMNNNLSFLFASFTTNT